MESIVNSLFPILVVTVIVWIYLCEKLFKKLKNQYSNLYEELGKPSSFSNSSNASTKAFLKFLIYKKWKTIDDVAIHILCKQLMVVFIVSSILLCICFVSIWATVLSAL